VFTVINKKRELIAQKLDDNGIHLYARKFIEGLLRKSVPQSKVAARLLLNVLCWCTSEACKCSVRSVIVMAPRLLLAQVKYWALRGLLALLQKSAVLPDAIKQTKNRARLHLARPQCRLTFTASFNTITAIQVIRSRTNDPK